MDLKSETTLVEAAQNGHLESFAALYQRYYSSMVALGYCLLANRDLAEDAAQETFAIACQDLPNLRRKDKFAAWLGGICRNVARQMLRAKAKTAAVDGQRSTDRTENQEHRTNVIRRAVWQLRPAERELIVLRYYDNLPYEQIAQVLDISIQAVNGRLIRARRKIAQHLERNGLTGDDYEKP